MQAVLGSALTGESVGEICAAGLTEVGMSSVLARVDERSGLGMVTGVVTTFWQARPVGGK